MFKRLLNKKTSGIIYESIVIAAGLGLVDHSV